MSLHDEVAILGAGIGGLTFALSLHQAGISCRVYEAVSELKPLGVGINLLPTAMREMDELGLMPALASVAITTQEAAFFNGHGQLIYREPAGRAAGYDWPQLSIHRGDLQAVLLEAARARLGADGIVTAHRATRVEQHGDGVTVQFTDAEGNDRPPVQARIVVACDGLHSAIRRQFHPHEGAPRYSGVNMWRGVTRCKPFLTGGTMVRAGWFTPGKMVIYPIRDTLDGEGSQLVNWVAEIATPQHLARRDWNRAGRLADFLPAYRGWRFDWLDVPAMLEASEVIYEFPMVDQDPLPRWTFGCVTLLGDAAHPMVPRGSNGAVQAIIDARYLAGLLKREGLAASTLQQYETMRREATGKIVLMNRTNPPDAILREVHERSGGKPYGRIEDVVSREELAAIAHRYRLVSGAEVESLRARAPYV